MNIIPRKITCKFIVACFLFIHFVAPCGQNSPSDLIPDSKPSNKNSADKNMAVSQLTENVKEPGYVDRIKISELDELPPFIKTGMEIEDYTVGGGDVLKIVVYDEPDLSINQIRVSIDGYINFPLLGKVNVSGLTTSELEAKLEAELKDGYILYPQISVLVIDYASRKVFILGAVNHPGSYQLKGQTTLVEMISKAGGIGSGAGENFIILRMVEGKPQSIAVNRKKLIDEGDLSLNILVKDHDVIYVPNAKVFYLYGEVRKPGPYQLGEHNRTILSAITQAGGFTKIGSPKRTRIVRVVNGEVETLYVNVDDIIKKGDKEKDIELMPGDVIIIPEVLF